MKLKSFILVVVSIIALIVTVNAAIATNGFKSPLTTTIIENAALDKKPVVVHLSMPIEQDFTVLYVPTAAQGVLVFGTPRAGYFFFYNNSRLYESET